MASSASSQPAFSCDPMDKCFFFSTSLWFSGQCQGRICPTDLEITPVLCPSSRVAVQGPSRPPRP